MIECGNWEYLSPLVTIVVLITIIFTIYFIYLWDDFIISEDLMTYELFVDIVASFCTAYTVTSDGMFDPYGQHLSILFL